MRSSLRSAVPSMFHRRLILLTVLTLLIGGSLGIATARLTTGESFREARREAESKLKSTRFTSTVRGRILDRNGLELAKDEPGWEVAVHFDVITGDWAYARAVADAKRDKLAWEEMDDAQRAAKINTLQKDYDQQVEMLFTTLAQIGGLEPGEMRQRRDHIVKRVHELQSHLWDVWQKQEEAQRGEPVERSEVEEPIEAQNQHHVILQDLGDELRLELEKFIAVGSDERNDEDAESLRVWQQVELRRLTVRRYPHDVMRVTLDRSLLPEPLKNDEPVRITVSGVGTHLVGLMREAWREDVADNPFYKRGGGYDLSGYRGGDRIGRSGIELAMEDVLRGTRGVKTINLDTGELSSEVLPQAGKDVLLTLDIQLQAQVQAVMMPEFGLMVFQPWHLKSEDPQDLLGTPLNGGAVVMDIASGDVLAAVTMPAAPREILDEDPELLWRDPVNRPMVNRALAVAYPPGSTVKPIVAVAAMGDGVLGEHETINVGGYLWENKPEVFRDWAWKQFKVTRGDITAIDAIKFSNNPYFGKLAERLMERYDRRRLESWYRQLGLIGDTDIGLPEATSGFYSADSHADVCFTSIGQGPISVSPLQVCTAYTRLVSGQLNRPARLIARPNVTPELTEPIKHRPTAAGLRVLMEGMKQAANERDGTASMLRVQDSTGQRQKIFNVPGVTVMAKSGTADPGARWVDYNFNNKPEPGEVFPDARDHAWVLALIQPDGAPKPTHVVAVVVEHSGSGGQIAGPVVNQIIYALKQHQYLDWPPTR